MKLTKRAHSQGFTLVELLVVASIVALLTAISIPIGIRAYNAGKSAAATAVMKEATLATNAYFDAHGTLEYNFALAADGAGMTSINGKAAPEDAIATDGYSTFIAAITGNGNGTRTRISYFKLKDAALDGDDKATDGITRDAANIPHGMVDPWGNPYFIQADIDYDRTLTIPADAGTGLSGTIVNLSSGKIFMISAGPDREFGTDDDITSLR